MKDGIIHISYVKTDFDCPECGKHYTESDYYEQLSKSKDIFIYKKCKECGIKMGISSDYMGNVVVWDKANEQIL